MSLNLPLSIGQSPFTKYGLIQKRGRILRNTLDVHLYPSIHLSNIYIHISADIYIYIYLYIYTFIYIYTYIYIPVCKLYIVYIASYCFPKCFLHLWCLLPPTPASCMMARTCVCWPPPQGRVQPLHSIQSPRTHATWVGDLVKPRCTKCKGGKTW